MTLFLLRVDVQQMSWVALVKSPTKKKKKASMSDFGPEMGSWVRPERDPHHMGWTLQWAFQLFSSQKAHDSVCPHHPH